MYISKAILNVLSHIVSCREDTIREVFIAEVTVTRYTYETHIYSSLINPQNIKEIRFKLLSQEQRC